MGYYPMDAGGDGRIKTSVRLTSEQRADVDLIADLWNGFDAALGRTGGKSWTATSVLERLIAVGIDGFWQEVGGRPESSGDRAEFIRRAVERLTSERKRRP